MKEVKEISEQKWVEPEDIPPYDGQEDDDPFNREDVLDLNDQFDK